MANAKDKQVKIKLDDTYTLDIDRWNYWITKKITAGEKAKKPGKDYDRAYGGYFTNFTDCMQNFVKKQPQFSEVKSITALMKCEKDGAKEVQGWCKDLNAALKVLQSDKKYMPLLKALASEMNKK